MISELDALVGILLGIVIIYFFVWRRSKIIGGFSLLLLTLTTLIIYGGSNHEMISWLMIGCSVIVLFTEFAYGKWGYATS